MKVSKQTIIRTAVLIFALINQVLTVLNINPLPFSEEEVYEAVSLVLTAASSIWAWWKNNSFTSKAVLADQYLADLKAGEQK